MIQNSKKLTSNWPLPEKGVRFQTPQFLIKLLSGHCLGRDIYPLAAGYYPEAGGHAMERKEHDSHLLIYCVAGRGTLLAGGGRWQVAPGDLVSLPKGTAHTYRSDRDDPWSIYWVHYDGLLANEFIAFLSMEDPVSPLGIHPSLVASFVSLFSLRRRGQQERAFIHGAAQLRELLTAIGWWRTQGAHGRGDSINMDDIEQLMHRRIAGRLSLAELAEEAGMSRYHFIRKFRAQTGFSPIQYFIHLKIQQACILLDTDNLPIKQIAMMLGYEDVYYFSRLFKKTMGVSPDRYRRASLV